MCQGFCASPFWDPSFLSTDGTCLILVFESFERSFQRLARGVLREDFGFRSYAHFLERSSKGIVIKRLVIRFQARDQTVQTFLHNIFIPLKDSRATLKICAVTSGTLLVR
jgi:hypothetical protein